MTYRSLWNIVHAMLDPTPDEELERQMMDEGEPKSEREHWAFREITRLRRELHHLRTDPWPNIYL